MTDEAPAIPAPVAERLQTLQPVYDEIKALQAEAKTLAEARDARGELDRSLAGDQRALVDAVRRRDRLRLEVQQLENRTPGPTPVVVAPRPRTAAVVRSDVGDRTLRQWMEAPLPPPAAGEDRAELTNFVRRFLRYTLNTAYPEMLAQFNQIMNSTERPVGEGLALLDWELAYRRPLGVSEREAPQKWVDRLDRWAAELEKYRTALAGDVGRLRPSVAAVLPHLEAWRTRAADPAPWTAYVAGEKAALAAQAAPVEQECEKLAARLAELQAGQGQP